MNKQEKYYQILKKHPIFREINEEELPSLLTELGGYFKDYQKNERIRSCGQELSSLGIVLTGGIQASMPKDDNDQIIERFRAGDTFGEAAVFAGQISPVDITAMEKSVLVFIPARNILEGYRNPLTAKLGMNLLQETSRKTLKLSMKIRILKEKKLRVRIMRYLGSLVPDGKGMLTMTYNRTDLAQFLGVNRSALSRELAALVQEGILSLDKQKVKIENPMMFKMMQEEMI